MSVDYPYDYNVHANKLNLGELAIDLRLYGLSLIWLTITMPYQHDVIPSSVTYIEVYNAYVNQKATHLYSRVLLSEIL